jgi:glycosyltransferase involved in cell wall biosynthesis
MASVNGAPPVICLDGRMLDARATGVGRYADTLLATLRQAGAQPMILAARGDPCGPMRRWFRAWRTSPRLARRIGAEGLLAGPPDLFREAQAFFDLHRRLLPVITDAAPGVMHWTYPVPLRMEGWRNIYTVHDAIPLSQPALTPIDTQRHRRLLQAIARGADRLITVSEAARSDLIVSLGCDAGLVVAAPQGVAALPTNGLLPRGLSAGGFYLFCGSIEPRKNLVRLSQAHAASGAVRPLVIAGPEGWRAQDIMARITAFPGVIRLPYQSRESLGALVRDARALLFPSLAEGFGLPVIEAMLMGTPVLTSALAALRETAGGAALLVDPHDGEAMAAAIARLDQDDVLIADLTAAGRQRATAFSLPAYAARLAAIHADQMELGL